MRVAILAGNGTLDRQRKRILENNHINGDIIASIHKRTLQNYDILIVSPTNDIPNLPVVIEQIVVTKQVQVIYIGKTTSIGQFYNVMNDPFFHLVQDWTVDVELPLLVRTIAKFQRRLNHLTTTNTKLEERLETINMTNKAKKILMTKGMTEEEAHQFIQKQAMDLRISKKRYVNLIIKNKIDI